MCRLVAYLGAEVLLEDILVKPINSIVSQSLHARESTAPTNGDGFGLGWYTPKINHEPALFTSIFPAWNDRNLLNLTSKITSPCFFAHVRAASVGGINTYNCHPFIYKKWMLMHNGQIQDFIAVKRHLRRLLDDDIYNWIQGETDSEHIFALFMQLAKGKDSGDLSVMAEVLQQTFQVIHDLVTQYAEPGPSYFNICVTGGKQIIASRYCSDANMPSESLYYLAGNLFSNKDNFHKQRKLDKHECVLIASEKLTDFNPEWHSVPDNHMLLVDTDRRVHLRPICITP